jgi:hypothetical protein
MYIAVYPQVLETAALQSKELERLKGPKKMTDDELVKCLIDSGLLSKEELEKEENRKAELSNLTEALANSCKNR